MSAFFTKVREKVLGLISTFYHGGFAEMHAFVQFLIWFQIVINDKVS